MILNAIIDDRVYELNVPKALLSEAEAFFERLDRDMDGGWQMSREWVASPDRMQRCQIVADKLLTALETENDRLGRMMAAYLLARLPGLERVELDLQGEIQNHAFGFANETPLDEIASTGREAPAVGGKLEAMQRAGEAVTNVFRVGRGYRFSVFDPEAEAWRDSPLFATEEEASGMRQRAFKERYESLLGSEPR